MPQAPTPVLKKQVEDILNRHEEMDRDRKKFEVLWRKTASLIDINNNDFTTSQRYDAGGEQKGEKVFDNTAILARDRLAAAHESMITPRNAKWHGLKATDEALVDNEEVTEYLDTIRDRLFSARYRPSANFASQLGAYYQSLVTYGTGAMFIDERPGEGLRYKCLHLNELFILEDHAGVVDTVHRQFELTAKAAVQKSDELGWSLPDTIRNAARTNPTQRYWFLHCVYPNDGSMAGYGARDVAYTSVYIAKDQAHLCGSGGFRTMPYAVGRYVTGARETYGRGPGQTVLRDIQMLQEMNKSAIRVAQRISDPPLFASEETDVLAALSLRPGHINYGGINPDGSPSVVPFQDTARLAEALELIQDRRQAVNDAFLVTLFQVLLEKPPNMTATEALLRAQEKGVLLTPVMGRQQSEFLGRLIEREIDIMTEAGQFDDVPMPEIMRDMGAGVELVYDAPLNRLQRTDEAVGILRTVEALAEPAKIDPSVYDVLEWPKVARVLADANGAPAKVLRTVEEMAELAAERKQGEALQQASVVGPAIGKTIKDLAQAQATAQSVPQPIPMVQPA